MNQRSLNQRSRTALILANLGLLIFALTYKSTLLQAAAPDLVGTWMSPAPNAYYYPGQQIAGYPNTNAFTERFVFTEKSGALTGTFVSMTGDKPLRDLKAEGQTISFSQGSNKFHGQMKGNELQLLANWDGGSRSEPFICRKATAEDFKIIEAGPTYSYQKLPLPALHDVSGDNAAPTPPMGIGNFTVTSDAEVRKMADLMVDDGLRDAGYVYIQIDEGWQGRRDAQGKIHPNANFPDMKALADYVHSKGLKLGIYSSPGPAACWGYAGSYGHEQQDANSFAEWGIDYLKYDWCTAGEIYHTRDEMLAANQKMGEALRATGRPIVFGLCEYGLFDVASWGKKAGANLWRTTGDIADRWDSMISNGFDHNGKLGHSGPDGWNDPDDLQTGIGGMTADEYRTQFTLWSIMAAPLLIEKNNNHVAAWPPAIKDILLNKEVIAVDQDSLGSQGHRVLQQGPIEVWTKALSDGTTAVALFNRGEKEQQANVRWDQIKLSNVRSARDLWRKAAVENPGEGYKATLSSHNAVLLKVAVAK
jgi:alpha-galactosidase